MSNKTQDVKKQQKEEARRAKAKAKARANIEKRRKAAMTADANAKTNLKKGSAKSHKASKRKKQLRPSTRGWISLFGGIIVLAILILLIVTAVLMGHDAPGIYGALGLFDMALGLVILYIGLTALKEDGTSLLSAKIGMVFSSITIAVYVFLYCIGLS